METCRDHPSHPAAWRCTQCGAKLCEWCAAPTHLPRHRVVRCVHCGALAEPMLVSRRAPPFWRMIPAFLAGIFSLRGIPQLFALAVFLWLAPFVPILGALLYLGAYAGYYFLVIKQTAEGDTGLPLPADAEDWWDGFLLPTVRFVAATALLWAPALAYVILRIGWRSLAADPTELLTDPLLLAIVVASLLYFPAAMIVTAVVDSVLAAMNPVTVVRIALRCPGSYLALVGLWLLFSVLEALWTQALGLFARAVPIPVVVSILVQAASLILPLTMAKMFGWFVYQHAEPLGLARPGATLAPALPDAQPRGRWSEPSPAAPAGAPEGPGGSRRPPAVPDGGSAPPVDHAIPLAESDLAGPPLALGTADLVAGPSVPAQDLDHRAIDLDHRAFDQDEERLMLDWPDAAPSPPPDAAGTALARLLEQGDLPAAAQVYRERFTAPQAPLLSPAVELLAADALALDGDAATAVRAYHRLARQAPADPLAPEALRRAARLLRDELGQGAAAAALEDHLARYYPDSTQPD